jgi:hypothetical protein
MESEENMKAFPPLFPQSLEIAKQQRLPHFHRTTTMSHQENLY